ncbi:hypothetical protein A6F49_02930 [Enteractinococcus helveticum]|uniref:Uncharacterized protein n=2 Tax=Enteractinococcus helveticum TaxID=1837282 RepID=A0A1B7M3E9_9MICC|nr:hypothetical protein A6F49_02930 [Enteractinococcus helveticum]
MMTPASWYAYEEVFQGGKFSFHKPVPGFRIDAVFSDGRIGDYHDSGTRHGKCLVQYRSGMFSKQSFGRQFAQAARQRHLGPPYALEQCDECSCGYRLVRNPWDLIMYAVQIQIYDAVNGRLARTRLYGDLFGRGDRIGLALTRCGGYGTAEKTVDPNDPADSTIRVSKTRLVEVWLPTMTDEGAPVPSGVAQKIRDRYGVTVRTIKGQLADFQGVPDLPTPEDWSVYLEAVRESHAEWLRYIELYGVTAARALYEGQGQANG